MIRHEKKFINELVGFFFLVHFFRLKPGLPMPEDIRNDETRL